MAKLKILLADDHRLVLEALTVCLQEDDEIDVVGTAESGEEVLRLLARTDVDMVVLDLCMPGMDGLVCLDRIRAGYPSVKVVVLTGMDDPRFAHRALHRGASAFVYKRVDPRDLAGVLRQTAEQTVISQLADVQDVGRDVAEARGMLTPSELAVLEALASGLGNKQIAGELGLAPQTVKFHLTNIYRKLDVSNRTEAIRFAHDHGLIDSGALVYA